jgi:hypothetical protein
MLYLKQQAVSAQLITCCLLTVETWFQPQWRSCIPEDLSFALPIIIPSLILKCVTATQPACYNCSPQLGQLGNVCVKMTDTRGTACS